MVFSDTDIPLRLKNSYEDFRSDDLNFYREEHLILLLPFSQLPYTHTHQGHNKKETKGSCGISYELRYINAVHIEVLLEYACNR